MCGRAWITVDGDEIANFCTRANANAAVSSEPVPDGYGEFSRQDAYDACWAFVHDLSIEAALSDDDPLVQCLAVLDTRVGKRRLQELVPANLHSLAQKLWRVRLVAEGLPEPAP